MTSADIQDVAGSLQLCAGQPAGVEAVVHASFESNDTEAVLLVDGTNVNSLNRKVALHNVRQLCPSLATMCINFYRSNSDLFTGDVVLPSQEGTTQGDPLAMPLYGLATIPLIRRLPKSILQSWYADDASASGSITNLYSWWKDLAPNMDIMSILQRLGL